MCQRKTESLISTGSKPQCLVRLQVISVPTEFFLKKHHSTKHGKTYGKFTEILRKHFEIIEG